MALVPIVFTVVASVGALSLSSAEDRRAYAAAKGAAALGFAWIALSVDALNTTTGRLIVAGLIASGVGDVVLAWRGRLALLAGIVAFGLAHVLYTLSFLQHPLQPLAPFWSAAAILVGSATVGFWLAPHARGPMRPAVLGYMTVISVMLGTAWGTVPFTLGAFGALALYLSDLAVARDRFIAPGSVNKLWGLPLYYIGQVLLALFAH